MSAEIATTDPRGCSFLSYRRARSKEAGLLIQAQRERGIPTWQDIQNLDEEHTATELRRVLEDPTTANAVMWITPDVAGSQVIRKVEAPTIMERSEAKDSFFVIPVAAGGADYKAASDAVGSDISISKLEEWNIRRIKSDPACEADCHEIAKRVLERRIRAIHRHCGADEPLTLALFVRTAPPHCGHSWLTVDWTRRFRSRHATETTWKRYLLPALDDVVCAIEKHAPGRQIVASGRPSIAAAFALGRAFLAPRGLNVAWQQYTPGTGETSWSLSEEPEDVEISTTFRDSDMAATELAVLVSVNGAVEHAWKATRDSLPAFRGIVEVHYMREGRGPLGAGQALAFGRQAVAAARAARDKLRPQGAIHLFMAVPAGLAFLIGQLSNTLGPIRLYEHEESDTVGRYVPGPLLNG